MRILLSCLQDLRPHSIPAYAFWAPYFRNGIAEAGHEWVEIPDVDWAEGCTPLAPEQRRAWLDRTWGKTVDLVKDEQRAGRTIELFLSYLYPEQVEEGAIRSLRQLGIRCVNFFCDNVRQFRRVPKEYGCFDLHWVPEYEALGMYERARLSVCHLPMPVWIAPEDRTPPAMEDDRVAFIGSCDPLRRDLLARATELGAPIDIFGPGWTADDDTGKAQTVPRGKMQIVRNQMAFLRTQGVGQWIRRTTETLRPPPFSAIPASRVFPSAFGADYVRLTKNSAVTIGINRVPTYMRPRSNPLKYSRLRDIEAPMMGACYLTEWTEGLTKLYALGEEIETYKTAEELAAKIDRLLADRSKREQLRKAGQRRALTDWTVAASIKKLCSRLI